MKSFLPCLQWEERTSNQPTEDSQHKDQHWRQKDRHRWTGNDGMHFNKTKLGKSPMTTSKRGTRGEFDGDCGTKEHLCKNLLQGLARGSPTTVHLREQTVSSTKTLRLEAERNCDAMAHGWRRASSSRWFDHGLTLSVANTPAWWRTRAACVMGTCAAQHGVVKCIAGSWRERERGDGRKAATSRVWHP